MFWTLEIPGFTVVSMLGWRCSRRWLRRLLCCAMWRRVVRLKFADVRGMTYYIHIQGGRVSQACRLLLVGYLIGLLFDSENGSSMLLWKVGGLLPGHTASNPRRQNSLKHQRVLHHIHVCAAKTSHICISTRLESCVLEARSNLSRMRS
jgi:hypothetical protein